MGGRDEGGDGVECTLPHAAEVGTEAVEVGDGADACAVEAGTEAGGDGEGDDAHAVEAGAGRLRRNDRASVPCE